MAYRGDNVDPANRHQMQQMINEPERMPLVFLSDKTYKLSIQQRMKNRVYDAKRRARYAVTEMPCSYKNCTRPKKRSRSRTCARHKRLGHVQREQHRRDSERNNRNSNNQNGSSDDELDLSDLDFSNSNNSNGISNNGNGISNNGNGISNNGNGIGNSNQRFDLGNSGNGTPLDNSNSNVYGNGNHLYDLDIGNSPVNGNEDDDLIIGNFTREQLSNALDGYDDDAFPDFLL